MLYVVFSNLKWKVIAPLIDIGGIVAIFWDIFSISPCFTLQKNMVSFTFLWEIVLSTIMSEKC